MAKSNTEHTPGPWHATDYGDVGFRSNRGCFHAVKMGPKMIACGERYWDIGRETEERANAALIAAAPDMLKALQALFKECAMIHRFGGVTCNVKESQAAIKAGLDAIAKATR